MTPCPPPKPPAGTSALFNAPLWDKVAFDGLPAAAVIPCTPVQNILYIAFREARILLRPQAANSKNELQDGLLFLNQLVDQWSARGCYAWTTTFLTYPALTPGYNPVRIGPNLVPPDFAATPRPVRLQSAQLILNTSNPVVTLPINLRDAAWYAAQTVKTIQTSVPTDLYYEPDFPNGSLYFWPVPDFPYGVILEVWVQLQQFQTLCDCFIAPPAYLASITLTLAEELSDIWGTQAPPNLARRAMKARDALQSNNNLAPRIKSADFGTMSRPKADFSYMTGTLPTGSNY